MLTLDFPTLAFAFALILIGYCLWDLDQLSGRRYSRATARVSLAGIGPADVAADTGPGCGAADDQTVPSVGSGGSGGSVRRGGSGGTTLSEILLSPAVKVGGRVTMGVVMVFIMLIAI